MIFLYILLLKNKGVKRCTNKPRVENAFYYIELESGTDVRGQSITRMRAYRQHQGCCISSKSKTLYIITMQSCIKLQLTAATRT